ncbi:carboxypeptidase regulatory-like domain-containing protein [Sorangium sp. So ce131]|uniref:carboxypeptidase regulatory-like domain-containing protein n=1 Tax=Sorangium sp. So ce131 TaxID=3133282 RepID=UPI003F642DE6
MKRPWFKQAWTFVVLGLALSALLVWSMRRRPAGAPAAGSDAAPASAAPAGPGARGRAPASQPRQPGSAAGRVVGLAGAPVAGAVVCATVESHVLSMTGAREPVCAPAAQDGRYTLSGLQPARWSISASAPGHRPAHYVTPDAFRAPFLDLGAGEARTGVDLTLAPGGVEVKGQVEDIGGGAISGALVMISRFGPGDVVVARSDAQGSYAAWVDEGPYMARAEADGYSAGFKDGVAPGPALKLLLTPASVLAGRVLEAGTGAPVEGATISLENDEGWGEMPGAAAAHSDAEGRFRVDRLPPGRYRILARAPGRFGQARESVVLGVGQTSSEVVVEVHPARTVTGRVEIAPDGAPCKSGNVGLMDTAPRGAMGVPIEADGAVRFDGVLPGTYQVRVACANQVVEPSYPPVVVGDVDVEGLVWTVRAGLTIRGRVVDRDGGPVRANVHAHAPEMMGRSGATGAFASNEPDGSFVLQGLLPAKYMIVAEPIDHVQPEPVEVELRDEHAPEVTIVADRGGAIEGTVTDADRKPVEGVHVMIASPPPMDADPLHMGPAPPRMNAAVSREDGSFVMKGLPPGEYRVWARENDMPPPPPPPGADPLAGGSQVVSATVKAGESARVALVVERRRGEIQGRVVDEVGEPVTDAFVHAVPESGGPAPPGASAVHMARSGAFSQSPVLTDPEGRFVLGGLREGVYTVRAYRKGGGDGIAEHVKTGDTVTLALQPAGAISGTLTVPGGKVPDRFTVRVIDRASMFFRSETFVFTEGAFTIGDLPEGKYTVSTAAQEGTAAAEVPLGPGEHRRGVVLALAPLAAVRGQVVSLDDGAPVVGVNVRIVNRAPGSMLPPGAMEDNLTDASGRFEVSGVASGRVAVILMPSDPMNSPYDGAAIPFDVQAGGSTDVGRIALPKRRLRPGDPPGDLGYSIKWGSDFMVDIVEMTFEVSEVRSAGPAAAAGLRVGDVIVSVDGHNVRGKMGYLYHALSTVPSGARVTLGLARGANVSITAGNVQPPPGMPGVPAYPR